MAKPSIFKVKLNMQLGLIGRGAIAGIIGAIVGMPLTLFTFGGGIYFLLGFNLYLLVFCVIFGMIQTPVIGSLQTNSRTLTVIFRMLIGGFVGVFVSFLFVVLINGIFSIVCTGILSGMLGNPSEEADL